MPRRPPGHDAAGITDAFLFAQRGFRGRGLHGRRADRPVRNINTSVLGADYWRPKVRLPGTGGANDIASLCREVIIVTAHEKRRFVERVDFVTSPSWLRGDGSRRAAGLLFGGVSRVVTTLGILGFDPDSKRMRIEATHAGVSTDAIRQNTGFALLEAPQIETPSRRPTRSSRCSAPWTRSGGSWAERCRPSGSRSRNFVGPAETPDIDALYAYAQRAEALGSSHSGRGTTSSSASSRPSRSWTPSAR